MKQSVIDQEPCEIIDIKDIVKNRKLIAHCQQIVSISRKMVIGIEGLIRGINSGSADYIQPKSLFAAARVENVAVELDRACRANILEDFSKVYHFNRDKLLFLNLDGYALETAFGSGYLLNQVRQNNIDPSNIVIEISEKDLISSSKLKDFTDTYRECGFMVALDDVGTGFSNMDRILLIKPDFIKIDISLVRNIQNDFYKQGVFKSLVILANKIGALVIAEGVENEEECIQVLRLGGHMIQGYYFSKPEKITDKKMLFTNSKIDALSKKYNDYMNLQYIHERNKYNHVNKVAADAAKKLSKTTRDTFDGTLREIVKSCPDMECAYVLDNQGIQISQTISDEHRMSKNKNLIF
jgi:EAL domain-containing protein (putative c-di-GMP-specific phosphodiesterase class I)